MRDVSSSSKETGFQERKMNFSVARDLYSKTRAVGYEDVSDPHEIIHLTLRELRRSLGVLAQGKVVATELRTTHMTRAFTAIYILQSSLDFDAGGEIAGNLFRIYEFCRTQLTLAFRRDPAANLDKCVQFIDEITAAWGEIAEKSR